MAVEFKNLWEAYNFLTRCPICKGRLGPMLLFKQDSSLITDISFTPKNVRLAIENSNPISINLLTNKFKHRGDLPDKLYVAQKCDKYHFYYSFVFEFQKNSKYIYNIKLEKEHFIRIINDKHYVVSTNFVEDNTSIRITNNYITQEIDIPATSFLGLTHKQFFKKLRVINILA